MSSYEKPVITDIGSLQELTAAKPTFGPVIPAYKSSKGGWHHGTSSRGTTRFSGAQTTT